MVVIEGKYKHDRSENLVPTLVAFGLTEEQAKKYEALKHGIEVKKNGDEISLTNTDVPEQLARPPLVFTLGKEFEESFQTGEKIKTTATLSGNVLTLASAGGSRSYEFTADGLVQTFSNGTVSGKRYYKRA